MEQEKQTNTGATGSNATKPAEKQVSVEGAWVDKRTFFEKYTLPNIISEIRSRLSSKSA